MLMKERSATRPLLERNELVPKERALCVAFLLSLALIAAALLTVLSVPPKSDALGPEPDIRVNERFRTQVALAAVEPERNALEAVSAIGGPALSLAYVPTNPSAVQAARRWKASLASSKRFHIQQVSVAARLVSHRKRAHAIFAHIGGRHRRAVAAILGSHATNTRFDVSTVKVDEAERGIARAQKCSGAASTCLISPTGVRLASAAVDGLSTEGIACAADSSSASRRAASLVGFFMLIQYGDRPEI
jgi:hypothetical protein